MLPERDIVFEIRTLNNLIKRDIEGCSGKHHAGHNKGVHGWAIGYFYENSDRDIFQKDFEEKFQIRRSTASNILKLMEKNGLIRRISVASDARLKKIVLTDEAIKLHKAILSDIHERDARLRRGLTEEEINTFFSVMKKFETNLTNRQKGEQNDKNTDEMRQGI